MVLTPFSNGKPFEVGIFTLGECRIGLIASILTFLHRIRRVRHQSHRIRNMGLPPGASSYEFVYDCTRNPTRARCGEGGVACGETRTTETAGKGELIPLKRSLRWVFAYLAFRLFGV